ncbi:MAG TPA: phosphotransferase [Candidatus Bathyarchaeia archaeon]|nr:phosphotransferase [Candidatus Bathyarchaeia archaeon]
MDEQIARGQLRSLYPNIELGQALSIGSRWFVFEGTLEGMMIVAKLNEKANQEKCSTQLARAILPEKLRVPRVVDAKKNTLLLEYINGNEPCISLLDDRCLCVEYLVEMQSIALRPGLKDYYFGKKLRNRLNAEYFYLTKALPKADQLQKIVPEFAFLLQNALNAVNGDALGVLSHGDYQPRNLLVESEKKVVPLDWTDFGRSHHAYDIGNLLFASSSKTFLAGIDFYLSKRGGTEDSVNFAISAASIAGVIRAGSHFRKIEFGTRYLVESSLKTVHDGYQLVKDLQEGDR